MGNRADITVRGASPQDAEAVSALLEASYPSLMALGTSQLSSLVPSHC
jgi:hypothetical protein